MTSCWRLVLQGAAEQQGHLLIGDRPGPTRSKFIVKTAQTPLDKTLAPLTDRRLRPLQLGRDLRVGLALGRPQHQLRPSYESVRQTTGRREAAQLSLFLRTQFQGCLRSAGQHNRRLTQPYTFNKYLWDSTLADADNEIAKAFGLVYTFPEDLKNIYSSVLNLDIQAINETSSWQLPIPARFFIGGDGVIRDVKADPDYRFRPEPSEVFDIAREVTEPTKTPA